MHSFTYLMTGLSAITTVLAISAGVTPHTQFSSSIGVLGCKINTNRVAYFPFPPTCDNMCVSVSHPSGRTLTLLHIDQSGGAFDIAYDAFNFLATGNFLTSGGPAIESGPVTMDYAQVPMEYCLDLLTDFAAPGKMTFSAPNPSFPTNCVVNTPGSWLANNYALSNILNTQCTNGIDEQCSLTPAMISQGLNQPACPHQLGVNAPLNMGAATVKDFVYGTTQLVNAA